MRIREGDPLLTTLTDFDSFYLAIHSLAERIKAEREHSANMFILNLFIINV